MFDLKNMNDNPLSRKWKDRYSKLPEHTQKELDEFDSKGYKEYQLKVIKRTRTVPKRGDVFFVNPKENKYFVGVVINDNVNNINGNELFVVLVLKNKVKSIDDKDFEIDFDNLLIEPTIVGKEYWTRGYFYNCGVFIENLPNFDYGFYSIGKGKYFDEFGHVLSYIPKFLGIFGVSTIIGIAYKVNKELIIDSSL